MTLIDTPLTTQADTEHLLLGVSQVSRGEVTICTHVLRQGRPRYAISISRDTSAPVDVGEFLGPDAAQWPTWPDVAQTGPDNDRTVDRPPADALREITSADGGRAVVFPGQQSVRDSVTVQTLLEVTAIDRVDVLGNGSLDPSDLLHTRNFLRPLWRRGALVLPVLPAGPGAFAPFEVPNPTPCCAEHR